MAIFGPPPPLVTICYYFFLPTLPYFAVQKVTKLSSERLSTEQILILYDSSSHKQMSEEINKENIGV